MSAGPIAYARADLAAALEKAQALPVHVTMPERLEPPCIVITEGTPLLEQGDSFGSVTVRLDANIVAAPVADNDLAIARLDAAVDEIAAALLHDWTIQVDAYQGVTTADSQRYIAARLTVSTTLTIS
ncbi:hypothetical protein [Schaalia hyovaginalis]|uniref:hypothetical protein n=1 Tax=Schaalia hyovaginalis TaxID=29316 RepID=UPI002A8299B0|nr:hypothetical protein [Schaalia hyovaginalis]MDY3665469.1 hypothetical protein [Schaalia hyovaginalis]MDY4491901.1 hypothetical protein [Schaalia hyovaginalis]